MKDIDVIVVGGGHAGMEAAFATSRLGMKTLLITTDLNKVSVMSCNPAIGGLAKGHMVKEMDILGGMMPLAADESCIQFKKLNSTKGPAVRGSRAQCDKKIYSQYMKALVDKTSIDTVETEVKSLIIERDEVKGVVTKDGTKIQSKAVIITTGTFMNATLHIGEKQKEGGRIGEPASKGLSDEFARFGFNVRRLKTGTPARLKKESINFLKLKEALGDDEFVPFSFRSLKKPKLPQIKCHMTNTTIETKEIIEKNLTKSPIYSGIISSTGPRYCPSIEDKITKFPDKETHLAFLEPEGLDTNSIYLQGVSTSLPEKIQIKFLKTMPGLENVEVLRYGYAVEYDFIEPTQIRHTLETKLLKNLFFAGQINGTSGYEEAAAQGLVAGVNATRKIMNKEEFVLSRTQSYIGVLIDDLVIKGTKEPYRMFTSRAEFRLNLREDNVIERLLETSQKFNLIDQKFCKKLNEIKEKRTVFKQQLNKFKVTPQTIHEKTGIKTKNSLTLDKLLLIQGINTDHVKALGFDKVEKDIFDPVVIDLKYQGYIQREKELIKQAKKLEDMPLKETMPYDQIKGLSKEEIEKLNRIKPPTLGAAFRISGVNPSAIQAIMFYKKKQKMKHKTI